MPAVVKCVAFKSKANVTADYMYVYENISPRNRAAQTSPVTPSASIKYQTMNYTEGCDHCLTVLEVAAKYRGFMAPPCAEKASAWITTSDY